MGGRAYEGVREHVVVVRILDYLGHEFNHLVQQLELLLTHQIVILVEICGNELIVESGVEGELLLLHQLVPSCLVHSELQVEFVLIRDILEVLQDYDIKHNRLEHFCCLTRVKSLQTLNSPLHNLSDQHEDCSWVAPAVFKLHVLQQL